MVRTLKTTVRLFDPETETEPRYETFTVEHRPRMRVLDVLVAIQEELGRSLAVEWYCGVKKCGVCGVRVNGEPVLACWEPAIDEMVVEPLDRFPLVRDLVVDRSRFEAERTKLDCSLERAAPYQGFPEPLSGADLRRTDKMAECIECQLCSSACPPYEDGFAGPAALVQLAKVAFDPRDAGSRGRVAVERGDLAACISCGRCTEVCPSGIPVLEVAIRGLRAQAIDEGVADVELNGTSSV